MSIQREISISSSFQDVNNTKGRRKGGQILIWNAHGGSQDGFDMLPLALISLLVL